MTEIFTLNEYIFNQLIIKMKPAQCRFSAIAEWCNYVTVKYAKRFVLGQAEFGIWLGNLLPPRCRTSTNFLCSSPAA